MVGVDPGPFTWRELYWMAEGRERLEWSQTALIAAITHNTQVSKASDLMQPDDYNPWARLDKRRTASKVITSPVVLAAMLGVGK